MVSHVKILRKIYAMRLKFAEQQMKSEWRELLEKTKKSLQHQSLRHQPIQHQRAQEWLTLVIKWTLNIFLCTTKPLENKIWKITTLSNKQVVVWNDLREQKKLFSSNSTRKIISILSLQKIKKPRRTSKNSSMISSKNET